MSSTEDFIAGQYQRPNQTLRTAETLSLYEQIFEANPAMKMLIEPGTGQIIDANEAAGAFYGYSKLELRRLSFQELSADQGEGTAAIESVQAFGAERFRRRHRLADGTLRTVEINAVTMKVQEEEYLYAILQDVTDSVEQLELQKARRQVLAMSASRRSVDSVLEYLAQTIVRLDQSLSVSAIVLDEGQPRLIGSTQRLKPVFDSDGKACWDVPIRGSEGGAIGAFRLRQNKGQHAQPQTAALIGELAEIAGIAIERMHAGQKLHHQARHDPLTGLPNRLLLTEKLHEALNHCGQQRQPLAVIVLDLDDFKLINDSLGHGAGDSLLRAVAKRLEKRAGQDRVLARLGDDEFGLVLPGATRIQAGKIAADLLGAISEPIAVGAHKLEVTPSIGISLFPNDGREANALLQAADTAMYAAKAAGKRSYSYFADAMSQEVTMRLTLESELRHAIQGGQLALLYQPRVDGSTGKIIGAEALVRWNHPKHGLLAPAAFLPIAEQTHLIQEIDAWVLREACEQGRRWRDQGLQIIISTNLSASALHASGTAERLAKIIHAAGLDPAHLEIEITESMLMADIHQATAQIERLKQLAPGLKVAIDDFGSGYSSLNYLRHLPIDTLKIDRTFITDLDRGPFGETAVPIVKTVIDLGLNLGLTVVAEGVETSEQSAQLSRLGCGQHQGFFYGRPMSASAFQKAVGTELPLLNSTC